MFKWSPGQLDSLANLLAQRRRLKARNSLLDFIQLQKPNYVADPFHEILCAIMERFFASVVARKRPRVIVVAPPQTGKSTVLSRYFPAWAFGKAPWLNIIGGAYSSDWADTFCGDVQRIVDSEVYRAVFPNTLIAGDSAPRSGAKRQADYFEIVGTEGRYKAAGRGKGVTGRPAHILLIDDPIKNAEEAMSDATRESVWQWYPQDLYTRLQEGAGVLATVTRWHLDDLIGRLLEAQTYPGADQWEVHAFPALNADETEALAPSRYSLDELLRIRANLSDVAWSSLYQGSPVALTGSILRADKWKYYGGPGQPGLPDQRQFDFIVQSWDGSFKDSTGSDFCAGQVWGCRGSERWLLDSVLEKMSYVRFKDAIRQMKYKWPKSSFILIEDKANGTAVMSDLSTEIGGLTPVEPCGGKIARAWRAASALAGGNCFLPDASIAWKLNIPVMDFVRRCNVFPANINKAGSDDDVDAFTQMVNKMGEYNFGLAKWIETKQAEQANGAQQEIYTALMEIDGVPTLLTFDEVRRV
jgi:predicted phage terminase large subunit-like protein